MVKAKTRYVCQECGYQTPKWMGRCPDCGAWNSLVEEVMAQPQEKKAGRPHLQPLAGGSSKPESLSAIHITAANRVDTGIRELNRVLGGGLVPGELVLLSGDPGIGKSTLIEEFARRSGARFIKLEGLRPKAKITNRDQLQFFNSQFFII